MLRLMLLRHAKAEGDCREGDHARRLSSRGVSEAGQLGGALAQHDLLPDLVLASDSMRTSMTMTGLLGQWPGKVGVRLMPSLYNASAGMLLGAIHQQSPDVKCLMLIGHNPGIAELALRLSGSGDRYALSRMRQKFPPCALAVLDFASSNWGEIGPETGRLDRYLTPDPQEAVP